MELMEVEMKFKVPSETPENIQLVNGVLEKLKVLNYVKTSGVVEVDSYFNAPDRNFAVTDEALRLRHSEDKLVVTYKGPKLGGAGKIRTELEIPLIKEHTFDYVQLLQNLGYTKVQDIKKKRGIWSSPINNILVMCDYIEELGYFFELELTVPEEGTETALRSIKVMAEQLGLHNEERKSYLQLVLEKQSG